MAESIGTSAKCQRSKRLPRDLNVSGLLVTFTGRQGPSTFGKVYKLGKIKKVY